MDREYAEASLARSVVRACLARRFVVSPRVSSRVVSSRAFPSRFTARRRRARLLRQKDVFSPSSFSRLGVVVFDVVVTLGRFPRDFFPPGFELGHGRRFRPTPPRRRSTRGFRVAILRLPRPELGVGRREVPFPTTRRARRRALVADGVVVAARAFVHRRGSRAKVGRRGWRRQGAKRRRELVVVPRVFRPDARRGVHLGPDLPVSVSASRARARRRLVVRARRAPVPVSLGARARVRAAARAAAVAPASAARSARSVSSPWTSRPRRHRASRPASSPPSGGVVGPDASGGIAIAFRAAPAGRQGRAAPGGGGGLDAPVTTTLSSGAGRARFARNWRSSAREGRGLPRGAAAKPSRDAAVDASRASGSVARVSASGLSLTPRPRAADPHQRLTVSEDARPAPDPTRRASRSGCISRAPPSRSRTSSSSSSATSRAWRPAGGGGQCAAGGKNPCAFRGMIATADPTRTWVSNSKLERRI